MIISLIGFMGTGKSSVGKELAQRLNYHYYDTDSEIIKREGISITAIFEKYGEEYFRKMETTVLQDIIINNKKVVLAAGGGIVLSAVNRRLLKEKTFPVLLEAGVEEIYNRIKSDSKRPLLQVNEPLAEIESLLKKRKRYYDDFDIRIKTDCLMIEEIVEQIIYIMKDSVLYEE